MKFLFYVCTLLVVCLLSEISGEKVSKHRHTHKKVISSESQEERKEEDAPVAPPSDSDVIDNRVPVVDPCMQVRCGAGRVCQVDELGEPQCVCIPKCPVETESRRKVCSNHNETWSSDCAIYQQRCLCDKGDPQCKGPQYKHVHIEYYGQCREMPHCSQEEMADFPRRMRDWLFNIMRDLADRQELTPHYLNMEREAESNMTRRWTNAAIWKFCDLDGHPPDRSVSRHELFPIRAPLMALEHCISPFLNSCDADNNHRITLKEWAKCLQLEEEEIEHQCEEIAEAEDNLELQ
ncbi:SPARC [Diorhabda sublineata]|uniref:SPARC n=1 Tax=Diorhabda sublineata TaxID=1163346 RepID=UPI0024E133BA|nr:SPARC [Diorhabda sublineata]